MEKAKRARKAETPKQLWMAVWIRAKMAQLLAEAKLRPWGSTAER
jgi:hypothetical protein